MEKNIDDVVLNPCKMDLEQTHLEFNEENKKKFEKIKAGYPEAKAMIMPTLWLAQRQWGWISERIMVFVAETLNVPLIWVQEVASFYTMFNKEPVGKFHIQVCRNLSCCLNGSEEITDYFSKKLGIQPGETTQDGQFTLSEVECLCACDQAPLAQVNDKYINKLNFKKIDRLIDEMRSQQ